MTPGLFVFSTMTNQSWQNAGLASHLTLKASKVDETWVGKISRVVVVDAEEEVEGEGGDHGGKELHTEKTNKQISIIVLPEIRLKGTHKTTTYYPPRQHLVPERGSFL